jgi:hypothetical protein
MYGDMIRNVFENPKSSMAHLSRRWLMPAVLMAIVIGATLVLVVTS